MTDFAALLLAVAGRTAPAGLADAMARVLPAYGINTPLRIAHFVGQVCEETGGFRVSRENLNYSAQGLLQTWPSHFTEAQAATLAHQPAKIAEQAYGGRADLGNGPIGSGDGAKFIGRGLIQITGRANYAKAATETGLPLLDHPELLEQWGDASVAASAAFWRRAGCNELADADGLIPITRRINGALLNLDTRRMYVGRAKAFLAANPTAPVQGGAGSAMPGIGGGGGGGAIDQVQNWVAQTGVAYTVAVKAGGTTTASERAGQAAPSPDPAASPADAQGQPLNVPSFGRSLWTAYGHRALAWIGGIATGAAAFLHNHLPELILFTGLAILIALIVIAWTRIREAHRDDLMRRALAATPPSNPEQSNVVRL